MLFDKKIVADENQLLRSEIKRLRGQQEDAALEGGQQLGAQQREASQQAERQAAEICRLQLVNERMQTTLESLLKRAATDGAQLSELQEKCSKESGSSASQAGLVNGLQARTAELETVIDRLNERAGTLLARYESGDLVGMLHGLKPPLIDP